METTIQTPSYTYHGRTYDRWITANRPNQSNHVPVAQLKLDSGTWIVTRYERTWSGQTIRDAMQAFITEFETIPTI